MDKAPESILIVGSGLLGLSSAWAIIKRPFFDKTAITVVDHARGQFPPEDAASVDASRIVRADYADPDYAALGAEAQEEWRKQGDGDVGGQGRYSENGLIVTAYGSSAPQVGEKSGMDYARASWDNVSQIAKTSGDSSKTLVLNSRKAIQEYAGVEKSGDWGYVNKLSGWANNGEAMKWLYEKVKATGRVSFVDGLVEELVTEGKRVNGAKLRDGTILRAKVVFCAAGAWTGSLIDLRGRCEATGHVMGYLKITPEEQAVLEHKASIINFTNGLFVIPPRDGVLKVARHGFGYLNPQTVTKALPASPSHEKKPFVASIPRTTRDGGPDRFPLDAEQDLRQALKEMVPIKGLENRPWIKTRICWYSDTRDADWLADWHPGWEGLFIATGDSGHAFKFMPVIGEKLVDCFQGKGGRLGDKWRWKQVKNDGLGTEINGTYHGLITWDGSRGGHPGMILDEELSKLESGKPRSKL
jgi:sarcosine oxidase / L-pipecolate oxidase